MLSSADSQNIHDQFKFGTNYIASKYSTQGNLNIYIRTYVSCIGIFYARLNFMLSWTQCGDLCSCTRLFAFLLHHLSAMRLEIMLEQFCLSDFLL